ncbi:MAG: hypothetical protein ACPGQS_10885 [Bradymonadia bacterium]
MDKVIGGAVLLLIIVSIWAVLPSDTQSTATGTQGRAKRAGATKIQTAKQSVAKSQTQVKAGKTVDATPLGTPSGTTELVKPMKIDMVDGEPINARVFAENPVQAPKGDIPLPETDTPTPDEEPPGPFHDVHWDGETDLADLEQSLLKLHAQRDGEGKLPQNVVASQVLRENVLQDLKVSANTPVVLIGDYGLDHPNVIVETLKRARKGQFLTGFTFEDPNSNGLGRRVYVKVLLN